MGSHGTGKLAVFVGGAPDDLDVARPVLSRYTHCLDYLGELGSGMAANWCATSWATTTWRPRTRYWLSPRRSETNCKRFDAF